MIRTALATGLLVLGAAVHAAAQGGERAQRIYRKNLARKLAAPWIVKGGWVLDYDRARARAKKTGKPIFAFFTRSYARSRDSERVESGTLAAPAFRNDFAKHVVLFLHVTSRVTGRPHDGLLRKVVDRGERYPTMLFLDGDGEILYEQPVDKPRVADLVASLGKVARLRSAQARARRSRSALVDLFVTKIELGLMKYPEAVAMQKDLPRLHGARKKKVAGLLATLEFDDLRAQRLPSVRLARRLVEMKDAGRIPAGERRWLFYWYILEQAGRDKDPKLYRECLDKVKDLKKYDRNFQRSIAVKEAELEKLARRRR